MNTKKSLKIAVIHDAFLYRGGGERLVTLMAKELDADLVSGFFSRWSFLPEELGFSGKKIPLGAPIFVKGIRHMVLKWRFFRHKNILDNYDIVILSGNCLDILSGIDTKKSPPNRPKILYYCHTPPRYLFDFRKMYLQKFPRIFRGVIEWFFDYQAKKYRQLLEKVDTIFTNSQNTHDRLLHFCQKESEILYPPTDTEKFVPKNSETNSIFLQNLREKLEKNTQKSSYYLSFSRLSPPKRVDSVVEAFLKMPDQNLVFTYGQNDPLKEKILEKCRDASHIFPIPAPSDENFITLLQNSIANIYLPIDEDFGMSPVEAMACGIPTIGVNDGGLKETIIDGKTGILLPKNFTENDLISAVKMLTPELAKTFSSDARARAEEFSLWHFIHRLRDFL